MNKFNLIKHEILILILIFSIGVFLRFFLLSKVPISLNWDEATFGYNAYSILKTGRDEYGSFLPLIFKSIGDYKNPLMVYLMVPSIAVFGLNEFSVRLPSALLGSLSILIIYLLTKRLTNKSNIALLSASFLAISPWHLQFSRAGLEIPVSLFLTLTAIYFFILSIEKNMKFLYITALAFGLGLYSYYSDRFFIPMMITVLFILFYKQLLSHLKEFIIASLIFFLLTVPLILPFFSHGSQNKILNTTLLGYHPPLSYINQLKKEDSGTVFYSLFHNDFVFYSWLILERYGNYFSPGYMFVKGPPDNRQRIFGMGMMYFFDLPLLLGGLYLLFKKRDKRLQFILIWLLIAPLPAAITRDEFHPRRAFEMIGPLMVILALGTDLLWNKFSRLKRSTKIVVGIIYTYLIGYCLGFYFFSYYILTPLKTFKGSGGWQYGYKQLVQKVSKIQNEYSKIIVDTEYQGPYIYFLFYEKYPPQKYQTQAELVYYCQGCLGEGAGFDNFVFRPIDWIADRNLKNVLLVIPPDKIDPNALGTNRAKIIDKVYFPNQEVAFYLVKTF